MRRSSFPQPGAPARVAATLGASRALAIELRRASRASGFQVERLAMGMTLAVETFLPLVFIGIALQRLQRRLQY